MATDEEDVTADGGTARGEHPHEPDLGGGILLACAAIGTVAGLLVSPGHGVAGMILGAVVGREYELGRLRV